MRVIGGFLLWYVPGAMALAKLTYSVSDFRLTSIQAGYVDVLVNLVVNNPTEKQILINSLTCEIYIEGLKVSEVAAKNVQINASGKTVITAPVRINPETVGQSIWKTLIDANFQNAVITFKGIARANFRPYPFQTSMTVNDLLTQ